MSELTKATMEEAKAIFAQYQKNVRVTHDIHNGPTCIQDIIHFLEMYKHVKDPCVTADHDVYACTNHIVIDFMIILSEEEVQKNIRRRTNEINIQKKQKEKTKLSTEKRLELEIKELEKQIARKKRKLGV